MEGAMQIRDAIAVDLESITAIYNQVLMTSTAIYNDKPVSVSDRLNWWHTRREQGYPVVVATEQEDVAGFASFGDFRAWPGYRYTVEHTVHVHPSWRGHGVGTQLVKELISRAQGAGKHVMVGGVDAENLASLRFHERLGFERVAHFREIGHKFGHYLDLIFLQYWITPPARTGADHYPTNDASEL
jgi:L-amino acid N-acyltransferase